MPAGRPTDYCPEVVAKICAGIAEGRSLRSVCREEGMPSLSVIFLWMQQHPEFLEQYTKAKQTGLEALAEDLLEISDDGKNDWMERLDKDGQSAGWVLNGEHVQRSRLRVDTRKWLLSKLVPKKYGEKVTQEVTGADGGPVQVIISGTDQSL